MLKDCSPNHCNSTIVNHSRPISKSSPSVLSSCTPSKCRVASVTSQHHLGRTLSPGLPAALLVRMKKLSLETDYDDEEENEACEEKDKNYENPTQENPKESPAKRC